MRLLLDENLSPRLIELFYDLYPGSQHVELAGLRGQPDQAIWEYAQRHDLAIVSKDNDFRTCNPALRARESEAMARSPR